MKKLDIQVPALGESITEATISKCFKKIGEYVEKDEVIVEIIDVETGEDITDEFTISMTLPEDSEGCPNK